MVFGLLLSFAVFAALCYFNPHYVEYLLWYWNGGARRALEKAGVSSFVEWYGLDKTIDVIETLAVRPAKLLARKNGDEGEFFRENVYFQHVLTVPAGQVSIDPKNHYSLQRTYFYEEKGEEFPFLGHFYLARFPYFICKAIMDARLFWHKTTGTPVKASLIIPEGFRFHELSLLKDNLRKEAVVTFGSLEMLAYFAHAYHCQIIPVEIFL